ncbi:hypothetical protein DCAR_0727899 [Daucus carota subsp. sativus]|uniref:Uncharacterized protein n=1 Tax=Daucus carota subsp. sativus TaxID=79200 RepID=A0A164TFT9_DAUCS|nr:PREDICTED: uncharacterized protein LOC108195515 [Daucus carota subsp. sativus]WOH08458.1 hypothetical protein DCAR_0727899 [Daucus carota subsp. sativus]
MISLETLQATSRSINPISSPRISFSSNSLDDDDFISINPNSMAVKEKTRNVEFEFLSSENQTMLSADELFSEVWQMQQPEKLKTMSLNAEQQAEAGRAEDRSKAETKVGWLLDDDPSPRPPKCNVLWKELVRLRKQRSSTLSPSSSSSSSSLKSLDLRSIEERKQGSGSKDKHVKRMKKGLERSRSTSMRIRPMVNVPVCTHGRRNAVPPLLSFRKEKPEK